MSKELEDFKERTILEILALPAVNILKIDNGRYESMIIRNETTGITWNEPIVRGMLSINNELRYEISTLLWKYTVKECNWFHNIRDDHEAILRGDWKKLI